jgi:hypothetical protein
MSNSITPARDASFTNLAVENSVVRKRLVATDLTVGRLMATVFAADDVTGTTVTATDFLASGVPVISDFIVNSDPVFDGIVGVYPTIQEAVDAASVESFATGVKQTVLVSPGEYNEAVVMAPQVVLTGMGAPRSVTLSQTLTTASGVEIQNIRINVTLGPAISHVNSGTSLTLCKMSTQDPASPVIEVMPTAIGLLTIDNCEVGHGSLAPPTQLIHTHVGSISAINITDSVFNSANGVGAGEILLEGAAIDARYTRFNKGYVINSTGSACNFLWCDVNAGTTGAVTFTCTAAGSILVINCSVVSGDATNYLDTGATGTISFGGNTIRTAVTGRTGGGTLTTLSVDGVIV